MKQKILEIGVPNMNSRIYPRNVIDGMVESWTGKSIFGMIGMPTGIGCTLPIDMTQISHVVENLSVEDNWLVGDVKVLKTPQGAILDTNLSLGGVGVFRPAGFATTSRNVEGYDIITTYKLHSINFVLNDE
jgi:hypothetical protein